MSTTDNPSRSYRIQTSGNDVVVIVPAEPSMADIRNTSDLFNQVVRQMVKDQKS